MNELLKQWAELEPTVIEIDSDGEIEFSSSQFCYAKTHLIDGLLPGIVQFMAQQAIEARGWQWNVLVDVTGVYKADLCIHNDVTDQLEASSPAEALLSAYLKALKAMEVEG